MMTARKRVGPLPTHRLTVRHLIDYSSSDHFASDDSSIDSSSSSSSETSLDPSSNDLSDSSSDYSLLVTSSGMRPSHHLRSLVSSIPRSSAAIFDRPSHDSSFVNPSRKRSRSTAAYVPSPESAMDLEVSLAEGSEPSRYRRSDLEMDDDVERSDGSDIDLEIQVEYNDCIAYADALRVRGINSRFVVETVDREEIKMSVRGPVKVRVDRVTHPVIADDIPEPAQEEGAVEVTYETLGDLVQRFHDHTKEILVHHVQAIERVQGDQGHRIVATRQQSVDMLERIRELERDNMRLRDMMDVVSQRVTRTMPNTRSGASRAREGINEQIDHRLARALGARDAARNLEPLIGGGGKQEEVNGNGGNRNGGNGNEGGNGYNFRGFMPTRECTYHEFLKCQPISFNGTKGVVRLTCWFEKMETAFHISNYPEKYQAAYAMIWEELMKLMTEVYCPRNEIQKMETKLWDLAVKGNDLTSAENNSRDNRGQQLVFKRQNVRGQNVARAYTAENNEKKRPRHFRTDCPKLKNQNRGKKTRNKNGNKTENQTGGNEATARAYAIGGGGANPDSNVITGLLGHPFDIDLIPVELCSFDVIIGDDCDGKSKSKLNIISCMKTQKYIQKGCQVYLAQVTSKKAKDKSEEKRLEDVPIVREFPKVFLEDLPGLPHAR
uniref:Reverse transcriptase domain-containing protein n=1 Tax=Tanacetum cinerariifolium TaxID=118510 RepID=A0A699GVN4_TANCI|nr:hypothetical protein [Tanacetum cinerariifolium]